MITIHRKFSQPNSHGIGHPIIEAEFINPHTNQTLKTIALIDTGADECCLPADFADILGHNLALGEPKTIGTANGETRAYAHTMKIKVDDYCTGEITVDFVPNLTTALIGVKSFLCNFELIVDYPRQCFTLKEYFDRSGI